MPTPPVAWDSDPADPADLADEEAEDKPNKPTAAEEPDKKTQND